MLVSVVPNPSPLSMFHIALPVYRYSLFLNVNVNDILKLFKKCLREFLPHPDRTPLHFFGGVTMCCGCTPVFVLEIKMKFPLFISCDNVLEKNFTPGQYNPEILLQSS
ncbi:hypothetical protein NPIL_190921 [Nephila pilipes]|uniref:Uncharacterized protein n=1 Tax=Nephila pilipes TaxID=299642 RepID=A0A8X6UQI1_NEPPI|nr:hypothetical protein NPIL_190921 [Nephila pilipes]